MAGSGFFLSDETILPPLTVPAGAALLDLEQTTLPGIAHLVVETMIVSDQIDHYYCLDCPLSHDLT